MVLACVDVSYGDGFAIAGCVLFRQWRDREPTQRLTERVASAAPYVPGKFYLRELPPLLSVMSQLSGTLETVVVDGYVWLGGHGPGLGARLFAALEERVPVIGVAKTHWGRAAPPADLVSERRELAVTRGRSVKPLYVTAAGIDVERAAALVSQMHGEHRIPTLIKDVDTLVRRLARAEETT
jgi:deoxyribonuclease V